VQYNTSYSFLHELYCTSPHQLKLQKYQLHSWLSSTHFLFVLRPQTLLLFVEIFLFVDNPEERGANFPSFADRLEPPTFFLHTTTTTFDPSTSIITMGKQFYFFLSRGTQYLGGNGDIIISPNATTINRPPSRIFESTQYCPPRRHIHCLSHTVPAAKKVS
jgi:hypothetical protein